MKQKDIALIIIVIFISSIVSFFASSLLFNGGQSLHQKVEVVDKLSSDFPQPDPKYFNTHSVDPTQLIHIGTDSNSNPINAAATP